MLCESPVFTWPPSCGLNIYERGHRHRPGPGRGDSSLASRPQARGSHGRRSGTDGHSGGPSGQTGQTPDQSIDEMDGNGEYNVVPES